MNTETIFNEIMNSSLFRLIEGEIDLCEKIIELCDAIKAEEETDWSLGEYSDCSLDSLIVGAHWALTEWHAGQASISYAALCATGSIFSPGMADGPEPDSMEQTAYEQINQYFEERKINER